MIENATRMIADSPPPRTNTTTMTNATTNTTVLTELSTIEGYRVEKLSPQVIQLQQQDPIFAKVVQVTDECIRGIREMTAEFGRVVTHETTSEESELLGACHVGLGEALERYCSEANPQGVKIYDVQDFDATKCEEVMNLRDFYSDANDKYTLLESEPGFTAEQIVIMRQ
jgi:hypothetical protein